jgi:hypothetical protein
LASPFSTFALLGATEVRLPALLRSSKYFSPASMFFSSPPFAKFAARTVIAPWAALRGSLIATMFLYSGFIRSAQLWGTFLTRAVLTANEIVPVYQHIQFPSGSLA